MASDHSALVNSEYASEILITGHFPQESLQKLYCGSTACIFPAVNEGVGLPVIEAMACGLPIISSNLSFNRDVLNEKNSIMIDPNDINQIADAILTLRNNSEKCERMAEYSLQTAGGLSIDQRARNIIKFIDNHIKI